MEEILFPSKDFCAYCGEERADCDCLRKLRLIEPHACKVCGRHRHNRELYGICEDCRDHKHYFEANYSAAYYAGTMKKALMDFKYRGGIHLRKVLGEILYDKYVYEKKQMRDIDFVTFIPISVTRMLGRGYNQSGELAEEFSLLSGIPVLPLLKRIKHTKRLKNLGREERTLELKDSMKVKEEYLTIIRENKILIIDDIFTTGSTINEAARCLKGAGASSVYSLTVATR